MSKIKNILYIQNNLNSQDMDFLSNYFNINIHSILSLKLIDYNLEQLKQLINNYDIIILSGGPQHLTKLEINNYPEIFNQIEIVKIIKNTDKILIGICLGCQIIAHTFNNEIVSMQNLCVGFNYLDINSINLEYIHSSQDIYLLNLNYSLLKESFSFHYDCINFNKSNENEIVLIASSITNVPYIIKHKDAKIYGFQFHPEIRFKNFKCLIKKLNIFKNEILNLTDFSIKYFNPIILFHFFNNFINN
jgi:anthranilate/para-aminobenzoate synthase component II